MKFLAHFQSHIVADWKEFYCDYEGLRAKLRRNYPKSNFSNELASSLSHSDHQDFLGAFRNEMAKVSRAYSQVRLGEADALRMLGFDRRSVAFWRGFFFSVGSWKPTSVVPLLISLDLRNRWPPMNLRLISLRPLLRPLPHPPLVQRPSCMRN